MPSNSRPTGSAGRKLERHTGADGIIKFDIQDDYQNYGDVSLPSNIQNGKFEIPITNVEWNRDFDTNDIQHNGSLNPTLTTTGVRFEGSFEYTGQNPDLMEALARTNDKAGPRHVRPIRGTLTFKETAHEDPDANSGTTVQTLTFERCLITSVNRSYPSDDSTTVSCDWEAEDMSHTNNT